MTVGYSTIWPKSMGPEYAGKQTHFVSKIWAGYPLTINNGKNTIPAFPKEYFECRRKGLIDWYAHIPKYHTFRKDEQDRWKVGMKIHPVINNRTKDRFQFMPEMEVKGIQKIEIKYHGPVIKAANRDRVLIHIDDRFIGCASWDHVNQMYVDQNYNRNITKVALNDGFDSVEQFFAWFNEDWSGKIIHWTDLKY